MSCYFCDELSPCDGSVGIVYPKSPGSWRIEERRVFCYFHVSCFDEQSGFRMWYSQGIRCLFCSEYVHLFAGDVIVSGPTYNDWCHRKCWDHYGFDLE